MSNALREDGIWLVYDGACPLCTWAAGAIRLKKEFGALYLINVRDAADDPLIQEITVRGFDLDAGMIIYTSGQFYHGKDALQFMARHHDAGNCFTAFCKSLFCADIISSLTYPWLRKIRNFLLRRRGIGRINNLR